MTLTLHSRACTLVEQTDKGTISPITERVLESQEGKVSQPSMRGMVQPEKRVKT